MLGWLNLNLPGVINDAAIKNTGKAPLKGGLAHHFSTGMLATLLATPCSAPFLGTAVGFALSRGTPEIMMIFALLGLGLSTPYLVVAMAPRLASSLPKPGAWMVTLRKILGLALAGTTIWLLSVLYVQVGWQATTASTLAITAIAILLYLAHRYMGLARKLRAPVAIILGIMALSAPLLGTNPSPTQALAADRLWQPFDLPGITGHVTQGHIVFVDVTADWCITCQVNKAFVLDDDEIYQSLSAPGVFAMQADWTLPNADISRYLERFQRYGIPFNAIYGPGTPRGLVLPELLTKDAILDALNRARG
jgi:suppressor for copper-sensitivity B